MVLEEDKGERRDIGMGVHQIYEVTPTFTLHAFIIHPTSLLEMQLRDLISHQKHKSVKEQVQILNN